MWWSKGFKPNCSPEEWTDVDEERLMPFFFFRSSGKTEPCSILPFSIRGSAVGKFKIPRDSDGKLAEVRFSSENSNNVSIISGEGDGDQVKNKHRVIDDRALVLERHGVTASLMIITVIDGLLRVSAYPTVISREGVLVDLPERISEIYEAEINLMRKEVGIDFADSTVEKEVLGLLDELHRELGKQS